MPLPRVSLVGAGPGDPGLLTLRGRELLERADVVIYDYLAAAALLDFAPSGAERIYVGKKSGDDPAYQSAINALLLEKARAGRRVVRLKGGDPFIFGRGGEEAEALAAAGIPYEVVPGVTAGYAVPAYAGIPITHREVTSTVAFVTGHADPDDPSSGVCWDRLAVATGTLVLYMAWRNLAGIARKLIECGRSPQTPVAVIRWGATPRQQVVTGTLATIAAQVRERGLKPPTVIVVGEVVSLRETLAWFERLPLFGRRIVVTRPRPLPINFREPAPLARGLRERGALALELPVIELRDPESYEPLDLAVRELELYDWVLFTSANAVKRFFARVERLGRDARAIRGQVAAIGPATAAELRRHGVRADRMAAEYRAEGVLEALAEAMPGAGLEGRRILIPRAAVARDLLPRELEARGARVNVVEAYRTVAAEISAEALSEAAGSDLVTLTSSSTAENAPPELHAIPAASIGPITSEAARRAGFRVVAEASEYTVDGLLDAIERYFE